MSASPSSVISADRMPDFDAGSRDRPNNPLFNNRKLKLGTFGTNVAGGCALMVAIDGMLNADWPSTVALGKLADAMEFEATLPIGRWRGYGGATDFHGASFESYTWAAGLGASTNYSCVFSTSHVTTIHPILAAKQAVTIDHITAGRFALNVVAGWHQAEMEMFGAAMLSHDARYKYAAEWLTIIKELWRSEAEFDYEGKFFQIRKGFLQPKPLQKPFPAVMNAGGSDRGREFAARYCDLAFIVLECRDFVAAKAQVDAYRRLAWDEHRRALKIWTYAYVVQGESEEAARKYHNYCVTEKADWEAAANLAAMLGMNAATMTQADLQTAKTRLVSGWGAFPLIGTSDQIVNGLTNLSRIGLDGVVLSWPRYLEDMQYFSQQTLPLLVQAGLR